MGMSLSSELKKLSVGSKEVKEAYVGSIKIYPTSVSVDIDQYVTILPYDINQGFNLIFTANRYASGTLEVGFVEGGMLIGGWQTVTSGTPVSVPSGCIAVLRGNLVPGGESGIGNIRITSEFILHGNVMALLYGDNALGKKSLQGYDYAFANLFSRNENLLQVSGEFLPIMQLSTGCFSKMFAGCTNLIDAPILFAPTLVTDCYSMMFNGCEALQTIYAAFLTTPSSTYTNGWVSSVGDSGTFYKSTDASWNVTGVHGVPDGWAVFTTTFPIL